MNEPSASESRGQKARELLRRLCPVQVRRVPEPVELRVRGRERCRMAVPERNDGDAPAEVEVLTAAGVPDMAAVALHDRQVGTRVGLQDPLEPR